MKKLIILMVALLVVTMASTAMAAIELGGKAETQLEVTRDEDGEWQLTGKTGIDVQTGFVASGGQNVKAVVTLAPWRLNNFDNRGNPTGDFAGDYPSADPTYPLTITRMHLESQGAFWHGGPDLTTRVGDVVLNWNPYVAQMGLKRGVSVEGIEMGPIAAGAFYTLDHNTLGLNVGAEIEGINLKGMAVRHDLGNEFAAQADFEAVPGINLDGYFALDREQNALYRVNTSVETVPNMVLKAGYRANNDFDALNKNVNAYDEHTGFNIGMETEQSGVKLAANYDDPTKKAQLDAETKIEEIDLWASAELIEQQLRETTFGARRAIPVIDIPIIGEYEGWIGYENDTRTQKHSLRAVATIEDMIPQLQGLSLDSEVMIQDAQLAHWEIGADYAAPNGIDLGARYNNVVGPSITAGLKASF